MRKLFTAEKDVLLSLTPHDPVCKFQVEYQIKSSEIKIVCLAHRHSSSSKQTLVYIGCSDGVVMEFSTKERNIIREIKVDDIHYIPSQIDFFRTSQLFVTILSS